MASSNRRERELARQHEQRRRERRAAAAARRRRRNVVFTAILSAVLVVAALVAVAVWGDDDAVTAVPDPAATAEPTPAASAAAAADVCPAPTVAPPATPQSFPSEPPVTVDAATYTATLATNCGPVTMELDAAAAPHAVNSFAFLAEEGYFAGTTCHRLTTEADGIFVLQCGDPTASGSGGPGYTFSVENAPADGTYPAGTVAMARQGGDPDSNGSQFFIVYEDTTLPTDDGGYTVFGRVTEGLDRIREVAAAGVDPAAPPAPAQPVSIESVTVEKGA